MENVNCGKCGKSFLRMCEKFVLATDCIDFVNINLYCFKTIAILNKFLMHAVFDIDNDYLGYDISTNWL